MFCFVFVFVIVAIVVVAVVAVFCRFCLINKFASCRDFNSIGTCVQAVLDGSGNAKWSKIDCSDQSRKGFVCQMNQNIADIGKTIMLKATI